MILILVSGKYQVRISNQLCVAEAFATSFKSLDGHLKCRVGDSIKHTKVVCFTVLILHISDGGLNPLC